MRSRGSHISYSDKHSLNSSKKKKLSLIGHTTHCFIILNNYYYINFIHCTITIHQSQQYNKIHWLQIHDDERGEGEAAVLIQETTKKQKQTKSKLQLSEYTMNRGHIQYEWMTNQSITSIMRGKNTSMSRTERGTLSSYIIKLSDFISH